MILTAALVFTRLAYFASAIVLMGGSLFEYYAGEGPVKCSQRIGRISRPARIVLALVATTSTIAWLIFSYVDITGDAASLLRGKTWAAFFFDTSFGWIWLLRGVVLCLMIGLALVKQDTNIAAPIGILAGWFRKPGLIMLPPVTTFRSAYRWDPMPSISSPPVPGLAGFFRCSASLSLVRPRT